MVKNDKGNVIWSCCELMTGLHGAEELVSALCNLIHLLSSPWQQGAGSRLHFSLAGSWCLLGRNGRKVPSFQGF